ncbi:MAG TPA: hypothetical protein VLB69_13770 [Rudaea sp.]|nr:hypothetical protein [Rudaea sp.]
MLLLVDRFLFRQAPSESAAAPAKSIAVLPFENLSKDEDNAYFASGMRDEILTRLAAVRDLKVISRTSTEQYASHPPNLKVVATQLGVASVLEGSVQKAGDAVHINVQLIDARTDNHLWAQSYDRDLKDIFGVERAVAENVAEALKAQLLPAETARISAIPTQDPQAYDLYLRAGYHAKLGMEQDARVRSETPQAIALYEQALERDPNFALASSALAQGHMFMYWLGGDRNPAHVAAARAAAERALALQPDLGEGHLAMALYYYWGHRDYALALQELAVARRTLPNSADVELYFAAVARRQGHWDDAIAGFQHAVALDPRSSRYSDQLGQTYQQLRRYADADRAYAKAVMLAQDPVDERIRYALNDVAWKGDLAPLRAALGTPAPADESRPGNAIHLYRLGWWSRDYRAAARVAESSNIDQWDNLSNVVLPARLYLAWAYESLGAGPKARILYADLKDQAEAARPEQMDDENLHLTLAFADAGLGLKQEAVREGQKVASLVPVGKDAFSAPSYLVFLAQLHLRLGDSKIALDLLERLFKIPSGNVISPALLKLDPVWDPIRNDPRFAQLLTLGEKPVDIETMP